MKESAIHQIVTKTVLAPEVKKAKDNSTWYVLQRAILRLRLVALKSKSEIDIKNLSSETDQWKESFLNLKQSADIMLEQFQIEKETQNDVIKMMTKKILDMENVNMKNSNSSVTSQNVVRGKFNPHRLDCISKIS